MRMCRFLMLLFWMGVGIPHASAQFSYQYVEVLYDSAWTFRNLQLVPIRFKAGRGQGNGNYMSLSEAMVQKKASIRELPSKVGSDKGSVTITNKSKKTILVKSGDMLAGGKQDRILTKTVLIPPGQKKEVVSVFCIEKERWDNRPRQFFYGGSGDIELKRAIDVKRSQAALWKEIDRKFSLNNETSKTWSYLHLTGDTARQNAYTRFFREKFDESNGGFAGFLFVSGNSIMAVELFAKADYTATSFDAMVATYINSMTDKPDPPMVSQGRKIFFLDNVLTSRETQFKLMRKQGVAHRQDNELLHLVIYGTDF